MIESENRLVIYFIFGIFVIVIFLSLILQGVKPVYVNNAYQKSQDKIYTIQNGTDTYEVTVEGTHDASNTISMFNTLQTTIIILGSLVVLGGVLYIFLRTINKH